MNKKAFTLVELLIVISIISMLGSIIIATTTSVQAKGRDAKRVQQIRQIDLATRLYIDTLGYAPLATGGSIDCRPVDDPSSITEGEALACVARSTAVQGTFQSDAWEAFGTSLVSAGLISYLPSDPCGSQCDSLSDYDIGYTYVAPLAMQYYCYLGGGSCYVTDESYQLYAPLEQSDIPTGNDTGSEPYYPEAEDKNVPSGPSISAPTNLDVTFLYEGEPNTYQATDAAFSWDPSITTYEGASIRFYYIYKYDDGTYSLKSKLPPVPSVTNTLYYWAGVYGFEVDGSCWTITAEDTVGNISDYATPRCSAQGEWPEPHFDGVWYW